MNDELANSAEPSECEPQPSGESPASRNIRLWPGAVLIAVYWAVAKGVSIFDLPIGISFLTIAGVGLLVVLLFTTWWLSNRTIRGLDRLAVILAFVLGAVVAAAVSHKTMQIAGVLFAGLPLGFTAWILAAVVTHRFSRAVFRWGTITAICLSWAYVSLLRMDGIDGDMKAATHWRWEPSAEDTYLAERATPTATSDSRSDTADKVVASRGDWTAFRGPSRNGEVRGLRIATDWTASPPELVWKERIGPGWSSMLVIGGRLFTQEQAGEIEAVVCLDAATGKRLWTHEDETRFWDGQSGAGPRGTPAFADGKLYTQGATGKLNCLDAATGEVKWSRDILNDSGAALPMWGFSSSPLVLGDVVITYAGGKDDYGLLAYHVSDGSPAWRASTGNISYSSAQPVSLNGQEQVLFMSDSGLLAVDPASGEELWNYEAPSHGAWRATQPAQIGQGQVLFGSEDLGLVCLDVVRQGETWAASKRWESNSLKPAYNDFVLYQGSLYGFNGAFFSCIDIQDGKRRWKGGRYGHGQVLLLADQGLLIVSAESGEAVLASATPKRHRELGRFQAIEGKTWNHPALAHGCLYLRNDQEIACYRLPLANGEIAAR